MKKKLMKLGRRIEASYTLAFNEHKAVYAEPYKYYEVDTSCPPDKVGEVDYTKDIWELQFYPDTPIGFYRAISNDPTALLEWALELTKEKN